uniref:UPF0481 protein At3g47200-like n=1 Tax=Erigeron canadensis TaxID=72917 RepID=UPI001CB95360|nr:UPF0481 protein At3g47200-like [Erigeron canadensis]
MANIFDMDLDNQPQPSIFMVPRIYRDQNLSCFDPLEVSIGPFHKGNSNVQANEALKRKYMGDLLVRLKSPPQQTLERCFSKVNSLINEIKLCYGGMLNSHDSDVANMMVIDSCFILEFIQKVFEVNCPGFMLFEILLDLLRIENQIPFFVLQNIFDLTLLGIQRKNSLITLLIDHVFFGFHPCQAKLKIDNDGNDECNYKQILDILHKACRSDLSAEYGLPKAISHSVVELDRARLMFEPNEGGSMAMAMAIEYELFGVFGKPTLRMPVLTIDDATELVLWNLIAYEQFDPNVDGHYCWNHVPQDDLGCLSLESNHVYYSNYFTSFVVALDMLVDSTLDVVKLVESKVIVNRFSKEKAAKMIKGMFRGVVCRTFMYQQEFQQLDNYYKWANNQGWLNLFDDPRWDQFLGPNKLPSLFGLGTGKDKLKSC